MRDEENNMPHKIQELSDAESLLTSKEAASFMRVSESWLAKARMRGDGPAYAKYGRSVRYQKKDLIGYTRARLQRSTSSSTHSALDDAARSKSRDKH